MLSERRTKLVGIDKFAFRRDKKINSIKLKEKKFVSSMIED